MSYPPIPIIIPMLYDDDDEAEGERVFFDIDKDFDRIRLRVEAVAKRAYGDIYLTGEEIKRNRKIRFNWLGALLGFGIICLVLACIFYSANCINTSTYSWEVCESNDYDSLWKQLFYPFGDDEGNYLQSLAMVLCILYVAIAMALFGYVIALKWDTVTDTVKYLEITVSSNNTVISFTIDDNMDYLFEKEMMKEFPKSIRRSE